MIQFTVTTRNYYSNTSGQVQILKYPLLNTRDKTTTIVPFDKISKKYIREEAQEQGLECPKKITREALRDLLNNGLAIYFDVSK